MAPCGDGLGFSRMAHWPRGFAPSCLVSAIVASGLWRFVCHTKLRACNISQRNAWKWHDASDQLKSVSKYSSSNANVTCRYRLSRARNILPNSRIIINNLIILSSPPPPGRWSKQMDQSHDKPPRNVQSRGLSSSNLSIGANANVSQSQESKRQTDVQTDRQTDPVDERTNSGSGSRALYRVTRVMDRSRSPQWATGRRCIGTECFKADESNQVWLLFFFFLQFFTTFYSLLNGYIQSWM